MSIVNGVGPPRLEITRATGQTVTVTLPLPDRDGNKERPGHEALVQNAFDFEDMVQHIGFKPRWRISYQSFIDGVKLLELRYLLEETTKIVLTPHSDLPSRKFEVRLVNFTETKALGSIGTGGHEGLILEFESTKLLDAIPFPQTGLRDRKWSDFGNETWGDHQATVWHFMM